MENCLVTKLKSVVDNDALEVLGYLPIVYDATGDTEFIRSKYISVYPTSTGTLKLVARKGTFRDDDGGVLSSPIIVGADSLQTVHYTPGIVSIYDIQKETLKSITCNEIHLKKLYDLPNLELCLQVIVDNLDLKYLPKLKSFIVREKSDLTGNIKNMTNCPNLETLELSTDVNITGNIGDLGSLTKLTTLKLGASRKIEGNIEDFVAKQKISGRPSNTIGIDISWLGAGNNILYIDSKESISKDNLTLTWQTNGANTTINVNDVSTVITIAADGTWTRVS